MRGMDTNTATARTTHTTSVQDITSREGYGTLGHGTWLVSCSCGWRVRSTERGANRAEMTAADHRYHNR
jgi:hypothetical protein